MKTFIQFLKESKEYDEFFKSKLDKYKVSSPNELSDEEKKKFFSEIESEWTKEDLKESKSKPAFGTAEKFQYVVKIDSLERNDFFKQSFGRSLSDIRKVQAWQDTAETTEVYAKGKATLQAVKNWVKENNPSEYYAKWQADSSHYKDDSVEIYYKK